eukprot:COSAG02_NODE_54045_length_298_cov_0.778894_1_plen_94_part_10
MLYPSMGKISARSIEEFRLGLCHSSFYTIIYDGKALHSSLSGRSSRSTRQTMMSVQPRIVRGAPLILMATAAVAGAGEGCCAAMGALKLFTSPA